MQLIKLTSDSLHDACSPRSIQRADAYISSFYACGQSGDDTLVGKIRGNHGEYEVTLTVKSDNVSNYTCGCETSKTELCKHVAALGLTYIESPWLFSGTRIERNDIHSLEDLKYYIATTPLREIFVELKSKNIGITDISDIMKVSTNQLSSIIKEDSIGRTHQLTEPIKIACLYLLERSFKD